MHNIRFVTMHQSMRTIGLRLITSHRHRPLLVAESAQEEEEEEEEESESYEMESMMEPQHFGKGWRWTTEV